MRSGYVVCGFLAGLALAAGYVQWGSWRIIPFLRLPYPAERWAQFVLWPGVKAGHWSYTHLFSPVFNFQVSKTCAGLVGILVVGLVFAAAGYALNLLTGRRRLL